MPPDLPRRRACEAYFEYALRTVHVPTSSYSGKVTTWHHFSVKNIAKF